MQSAASRVAWPQRVLWVLCLEQACRRQDRMQYRRLKREH